MSDSERKSSDADVLGAEVPRRFARLQCRYGRWGLAYLESLLRAADALASSLAARQVAGERLAPEKGKL
jgi:CRISPR-associated endonuclease/helicase Cas3